MEKPKQSLGFNWDGMALAKPLITVNPPMLLNYSISTKKGGQDTAM